MSGEAFRDEHETLKDQMNAVERDSLPAEGSLLGMLYRLNRVQDVRDFEIKAKEASTHEDARNARILQTIDQLHYDPIPTRPDSGVRVDRYSYRQATEDNARVMQFHLVQVHNERKEESTWYGASAHWLSVDEEGQLQPDHDAAESGPSSYQQFESASTLIDFIHEQSTTVDKRVAGI